MTRAFVFPGQGSQAVGMGRELAQAFDSARRVFEEVDEALRHKLTRLMFEGPESELTLTENAQPALLAMSVAVARAVESEGGFALADKGAFVAGHSLGEYSALTAVRAISLADAARLLRRRGQAMQQAVPVGVGAMAAVLGLDLDAVQAIVAAAAAGEVCACANDNAPGQVVISGDKDAVARAVELVKKQGKKAIPLPVSAPFHCALMQPAADVMRGELASARIAPPTIPLVANVSAQAESDPETLRDLLVRQVTAMVRWRESMVWLKGQGVDTLVELGAGKVLSGLARRIDKELVGVAAGMPAEVEALLRGL